MGGNKSQPEARSWPEELQLLSARLGGPEMVVDIERTELTPGWDAGEPWEQLKRERDRILAIKTGLGWLSVDAATRVDRRLNAAGEIIDSRIAGRVSHAALQLRQAEFITQRAWWSRYWNSWPSWSSLLPSPFPAPMWLFISVFLAAALGVTVWVIYDQQFFPRGEDAELPEALFGAALWGFGGGVVTSMRTLHYRVQGQQFEIGRVAWYVLSPIIGFAFGAIAFLLFLTGLLSTGQTLEQVPTGTATQVMRVVDPTPILVLAVLAGLSQNAFIGALQQIVNARFRGSEEETTPTS